MPDDPRPLAVQRAALLADPTRARLLALLEASPSGRAVSDMATDLGLHHTSVRAHLRLLLDVGLVESVPQEPEGRGRPRHLYRARPRTAEPYRELAAMLMEAVGSGVSPEEAGRRAGRAAAAAHVDTDAITAVLDEAHRLGFRAETLQGGGSQPDDEGDDEHGGRAVSIVLRDCPYLEFVDTDPVTVCAVHLGFVRGVTEAIGGAHVESLHVDDPRRVGCRLRLALSPLGDG